jgi:cytochrome c biogenesis protein CcmG, thiol:disulfide interchange protein DsbE
MAKPSDQLKQTTDPRQAWLTLGLVIGVSVLFAFVILPYMRPKSKLEGGPAPDFALPVIHQGEAGNRVRLSDLRGKRVVLDFWASWCGPCREQAPILNALAQRHEAAGDLVVVGVNTSDEKDSAIQFARSANLAYVSVFDEGNRVAAAYSVTGLPTLVVVDEAGKIVAVRRNVVRQKELDQLVAR